MHKQPASLRRLARVARFPCALRVAGACRSWRHDGYGSTAILVDWKSNRIDALTDVYYLNSDDLSYRCACWLKCHVQAADEHQSLRTCAFHPMHAGLVACHARSLSYRCTAWLHGASHTAPTRLWAPDSVRIHTLASMWPADLVQCCAHILHPVKQAPTARPKA